MFSTEEVPKPTTSTPIETITKPLVKSTWSDIAKTTKPPKTGPPVACKNNTSSSSTPVQTKGIVIASFSDRLKKLRERRATKTKSNTSLPASLSHLATTTPVQSKPDAGNTSSNVKPLVNNYTSFTTNSVEHSPETHLKTDTLTSTSEQMSAKSFGTFESQNAVDRGFESDDDELPPAPPPPIPDLPPPSEEQEPVPTDPPTKSHTLTTKVSLRTSQWKEDWTRKSEQLQLDSFKSDSLPLLGLNSVHRVAPTIEEIPKTKLSDRNSLDSSLSGSAPSLPDSLPPDLPEAPPPTLPESPPLIITEASPILPEAPPPDPEQFQLESIETKQDEALLDSAPTLRSLDTSTADSKDNRDYSLNIVKLRERKTSPMLDTNSKRRSAFDALLTVEPSSEERDEPKLSMEERRKLAIMASRFSSADTDVALQVWNRQTASSQGTPQTDRSENESLASKSHSSVLNHSTSSLKVSQPTSRGDSPDVITKERRPSPVSSIDLNSSSGSTSRNVKEDEKMKLQQRPFSLSPSTEGPNKQIKVISEGTPPSSPNVRYTRVAKENWSPTVKKRSTNSFNDDLSASASTGNILPLAPGREKKTASVEKTSSLRSFGSGSNSPKTGLSSPWSIFKKSSTKKAKGLHPMSPLAAASVANHPQDNVPKSPTTISLSSNNSNESEEVKKPRKMIPTKFFPSDR